MYSKMLVTSCKSSADQDHTLVNGDNLKTNDQQHDVFKLISQLNNDNFNCIIKNCDIEPWLTNNIDVCLKNRNQIIGNKFFNILEDQYRKKIALENQLAAAQKKKENDPLITFESKLFLGEIEKLLVKHKDELSSVKMVANVKHQIPEGSKKWKRFCEAVDNFVSFLIAFGCLKYAVWLGSLFFWKLIGIAIIVVVLQYAIKWAIRYIVENWHNISSIFDQFLAKKMAEPEKDEEEQVILINDDTFSNIH